MLTIFWGSGGVQPQVASLKGKQSQPWDLPWDEMDAAKAADKVAVA